MARLRMIHRGVARHEDDHGGAVDGNTAYNKLEEPENEEEGQKNVIRASDDVMLACSSEEDSI